MVYSNYLVMQDSKVFLHPTILLNNIVKGGKGLSSSQILKGILEGCLLAIINKGETYGYEMIEKLDRYGFSMVKEGSIYPLLLRMKKQGLVETHQKKLPSGGPKRKYYTITEEGRQELDAFTERWHTISMGVNQLIKEEQNGKSVEGK